MNTTNELNTTEVTKNGGESEKPRTFMDCYTGFSSWGLLANMFTPADIDLTNPELKGLFSNMCNFIHDESGKWMNIWDVGEREILANEVNFTNFVPKYYPQGVPESLNKTFSQFGENFESGTNTTSVQ